MIVFTHFSSSNTKYFGFNLDQKWYLSQKIRNVLIGIFVLMSFFVRFLVFELWSILYFTVVNTKRGWTLTEGFIATYKHMSWKGLLRNMPLMLTSEARVLNARASGVQVCSSSRGCGGQSPPTKKEKIIFFKFLLSPECITIYTGKKKIYDISKTKNPTKKNVCEKSLSDQSGFNFLCIFWTFWRPITQKLKLEKSEIWFFFRFSTLHIFCVEIATSEGGGGSAYP